MHIDVFGERIIIKVRRQLMTATGLLSIGASRLEDYLRGRYGFPQNYDLTEHLHGEGTWMIRGWKLAETSKTQLYVNLTDRKCFIFIVLYANGEESKAWIPRDINNLIDISAEYLGAKDFKALFHALAPFVPTVQ